MEKVEMRDGGEKRAAWKEGSDIHERIREREQTAERERENRGRQQRTKKIGRHRDRQQRSEERNTPPLISGIVKPSASLT